MLRTSTTDKEGKNSYRWLESSLASIQDEDDYEAFLPSNQDTDDYENSHTYSKVVGGTEYHTNPPLSGTQERDEFGFPQVLLKTVEETSDYDSLSTTLSKEETDDYGIQNYTISILQTEKEKLLEAISLGNLDRTKELIKSRSVLNAKFSNGNTPLHFAIYHKNTSIAKELITAGADINAKSPDGNTLLNLAIHLEENEIAKELIKAGADLNITSPEGELPLVSVLWYGQLDVLKELINARVDVNRKSVNGNTPLHFAIYHKNTSIAMELIRAGADINAKSPDGNTLLNLAIHLEEIEIAKELIKAGADLNITSPFLPSNQDTDDYENSHTYSKVVGGTEYHTNPPLLETKERDEFGFPQVLLKTVEETSDYDSLSTTLSKEETDDYGIQNYTISILQTEKEKLLEAISLGNLDRTKELIKSRSVLNAKFSNGNTPLHFAIYHKNTSIAKELITAGADINAKSPDGNTLLNLAIHLEENEIAKELIKAGADLNITSPEGELPLVSVLWYGQLDVLKELINARVDVNRKSVNGNTPLHFAIYHKNTSIAMELIRAGADINAKSPDGNTLLNLAIHLEEIEIAKELIKAGADLNITSPNEETPLAMAIQKQQINVVNELIRAGADINIKSWNRTPLSYAEEVNFVEAVEALTVAGADVNTAAKYYQRSRDTSMDIKAEPTSPTTTLGYVEDTVYERMTYKSETSMSSPNQLVNVTPEDEYCQSDASMPASNQLVNVTPEDEYYQNVEDYEREMSSILNAIVNNDMTGLEDLVSDFYESKDIKKSVLNILFFAAATGTVESCQYLIDNGFAVNADLIHESILELLPKKEGLLANPISPLSFSMLYDKVENFRLILKHSSNEIIEKSKVISPKTEAIVLQELAGRLAKMYHSTSTVVPGYDNTSPVFAVYSQSRHSTRKQFCGITVKTKNPRKIKRECPLSSVYRSKESPIISKENMKIAEQVIAERSDMLWKTHTNLNIITMRAVKYIEGNEQLVPVCITLYCTSKGFVPLGEPLFPTTLCSLDGNHELPVDVREGYFEFCPLYPTSAGSIYHEKLKMGCSISRARNPINGGGSIGPFVDINGETGFLTCAHVLFNLAKDRLPYGDSTASAIAVVQPAVGSLMMNTTGSSGMHSAMRTPCGHITKAMFDHSQSTTIDAAVVQITNENRIPQFGQFAVDSEFNYTNAGFADLPVFNSGIWKDQTEISADDEVVKCGKSTHLTRGEAVAVGMQVRPLTISLGLPSTSHCFEVKNQIEVASLVDHCDFFGPGDSGSAVFTVEKDGTLACIGMAIGFTSEHSAVVTPIRPIFDAFDVKLKVFPECRNRQT